MKENFIELDSKIFQTIEIADTDKLKLDNKAKSEEVLSIKKWQPSRWECKINNQKSIQANCYLREKPKIYLYSKIKMLMELDIIN